MFTIKPRVEKKNIFMRIAHEIIEHTINKYDQFLHIPYIETSTFSTSVSYYDKGIINLYSAYGEIDQCRSEIMIDMNVESLLS